MPIAEIVRERTEYEDFVVEFMPNSHRYAIVQENRRYSVPSVTGVLKILNKPALIGWAERCGAEGALRMERAGDLTYPDGSCVRPEEAIQIIRQAGEGADARRNMGARRGLALHQAQQAYCELQDVPNVGDFDPEVRGYVQGYCRWLLRDEPEPILTEQVVGSSRHRYAGRLDMLARINGRIVLPDLKTSARAYPEQHLQIAGYWGAMRECYPQIEIDEGLIVIVGADGSFQTYPCVAHPIDFFKVLGCYRAIERVRKESKGLEVA
jgi:hypothetical protein